LIPVQFTAGDTSTKMVETITIKTDLSGGTTATCILTATVNMPTEGP
jgi:hypothetical protein